MIINPQIYFLFFSNVSRIVCVSQNISCACSNDVLVTHITLRGEESILPEYTCYVKQCHYNQTTALILLLTCSMFRIDLKNIFPFFSGLLYYTIGSEGICVVSTYITDINALFLMHRSTKFVRFLHKNRSSGDKFQYTVMQSIWAIQTLLKNFHSTKWTKILWQYQNRLGVHISWRVHITWIYPMLKVWSNEMKKMIF